MRIRTLSQQLQQLVYEYVCRSLFKADRLMFAMHMAHGTKPDLFGENVSHLYSFWYSRNKGEIPPWQRVTRLNTDITWSLFLLVRTYFCRRYKKEISFKNEKNNVNVNISLLEYSKLFIMYLCLSFLLWSIYPIVVDCNFFRNGKRSQECW